MLQSICQQIWKTQQWPQDWKRSVFIPIPKNAQVIQLHSIHSIQLRSIHSIQLHSIHSMPNNAQTTTQLHSSHTLAK